MALIDTLLNGIGTLAGSNVAQINPAFDPNKPVGPGNMPYLSPGAFGRLTGNHANQYNQQALQGTQQQAGVVNQQLRKQGGTDLALNNNQGLLNIIGQLVGGNVQKDVLGGTHMDLQENQNAANLIRQFLSIVGERGNIQTSGEETRKTQTHAAQLAAEELVRGYEGRGYSHEEAIKRANEHAALDTELRKAQINQAQAGTEQTKAGTRAIDTKTNREELENSGLNYMTQLGEHPLPMNQAYANQQGRVVVPGSMYNNPMFDMLQSGKMGIGAPPIKLAPNFGGQSPSVGVPNAQPAHAAPIQPPNTAPNAPAISAPQPMQMPSMQPSFNFSPNGGMQPDLSSLNTLSQLLQKAIQQQQNQGPSQSQIDEDTKNALSNF